MGISINIQRIKRARARAIGKFSTVDVFTDEHEFHECAFYLEGPGHEDCAARITALINEQVIRRDTKPTDVDRDIAAEDEAAFEQERQEEEQAESARRELEADEYARAFPKLRDREERRDDSEVLF
jgi:hypothetical protein